MLDQLVGKWLMQGTIAGNETRHDIEAKWVLGHYYLQLNEVSREMTVDGEPEYEATVLIGWDDTSDQYVCLWLDNTGGSGLSSGVIGRAKREGNQLPFVFRLPDESIIYNTFTRDPDNDTWEWLIDSEENGQRKIFARVKLIRQ
ncbi:MAG: DUF1579 family protein [Candidatus Krumholzibacteriota bacterium]|nr:DUF1579 family protein [Candidatus Krumholzibacteriota bacterium]